LKLSKKVTSVEKSKTLVLSAIARQMQAEGIDVVSLAAGEPDFPTPMHVKEAAIRAIEENFTKYTSNEGIPELRKAIAEKFRRDNNLHFEPSQILVSCGAKHAIYNALQAICNRGDEVIVIAPYWVSYPEMVKLADGVPKVLTATDTRNGKISPQQLSRAITRRTKALLFNSPSNPSGVVYSREEIEGIAEVVKRKGIYVISDEIYEKVIYGDVKHVSIGSIEEIQDQVITVNGVSKAYSMTGWRIGYLGAREEITAAAAKIQSQVTSNATSISQRAALAALTGSDEPIKAMVEEFKRRRDFFCRELQSIEGFDCPIPEGAFYVFPNIKKLLGISYNGRKIANSDDLSEYFLQEAHVATVPGTAFGSKEHIRLSYACSMKDLATAARRLREGVERLLD
jgi:aspartate aminotransferase